MQGSIPGRGNEHRLYEVEVPTTSPYSCGNTWLTSADRGPATNRTSFQQKAVTVDLLHQWLRSLGVSRRLTATNSFQWHYGRRAEERLGARIHRWWRKTEVRRLPELPPNAVFTPSLPTTVGFFSECTPRTWSPLFWRISWSCKWLAPYCVLVSSLRRHLRRSSPLPNFCAVPVKFRKTFV